MTLGTIIGVTPFGLPDARLVAALRAAGATGVLDLTGHDQRAEDELARAARWVPGTFGVRLGSDPPAGLLGALPDTVDLLVVPHDLAEWAAVVAGGRTVLVEVTDAAQAVAAVAAGADGLLARGSEAGGAAGELTTFVLLQQVLGAVPVPVWAWGGIGPHTAAAAVAGGAAGVVLDSALALLDEATPPPDLAAALATADGTGTVVRDGRRVWRPRGATRDVPAGQDLFLAAAAAGWGAVSDAPAAGVATGDVASTVRAVDLAIAAATGELAVQALEASAPFARRLGLQLPVVQGAMTRVSDRPALAAAVAAAGGLPCVALSLADGESSRTLLADTARKVNGRPWAAGILGFAPEEVRSAQLDAIRATRPTAVVIAGGRPSQAAALEDVGISVFLHVPSPGLLEQFLAAGARRFVFEGAECGGHIGPRSSFCLWQAQLPILVDHLDRNPGTTVDVVFAGGIHDARSAAMVAALAAPLTARGAGVGLLMGTAYLFTEEAVETGAIGATFQRELRGARSTAVLETAPGHLTRCVTSPYTEEFNGTRDRLRAAGTPDREMWEELERLNLGRLRIASKGIRRDGARLERVDETVQRDEGLFMAGQVAVLRDRVTTVADLHTQVTAGAKAWLASRAAARPLTTTAGAPEPPEPLDVAIVGLAGIFPGAPDTATYWSNVLAGVDSVTPVPAERWDPARHGMASAAGGFLPRVPFDPLAYGIPPASLAAIEPVQLLALEVAARALADYGRSFDRSRASVVFGAESGGELSSAAMMRATLPGYLSTIPSTVDEQLPAFTEDTFPGVLANVIAGRIANRLDLGGSNFTVDAACASSLAALDVACRELVAGTADLVLCGGADTHNGVYDYRLFASVGALSPTGRSRPFDRSADGIALGEGVGCLVLKRLADARRDGDRVYAVIRGIGSASDGRARGLTAPRPEGQRTALERAYAQARVSPADVGLVEAHGTGTAVGDRTELATLTAVFAGSAPGTVALGSVKSQIGHTKCAAGVAGVIKAALALHVGVRPPTTHLAEPHAEWSASESPFAFDRTARPWPEPAGGRVAAVSGFGFGGTNFHAVLTGGGDAPPRHGYDAWPAELFLFASAADAAWLRDRAVSGGPVRPRDLARTAAVRLDRAGGVAVAAVVASTVDELVSELDTVTVREPADRPPVAFLFPGQGSQRVGMLAPLLVAFPELQDLVDPRGDWAAALYPGAAFDPDAERRQRDLLRDTRHAQPALGAAGLAAHRFLAMAGVAPDMVAGHSYGELVALAAAGAVPAADLAALSTERAAAILGAVGGDPGTMAAVQAGAETVFDALTGIPGVVVANLNAPRQVVVSGATGAVASAVERLRARGIGVTALDVAGAFHSPLVAGAGAAFGAAVARVALRAPSVPVWSNRTARPYPDDAGQIAFELTEQIGAPVRFGEQVEAMYAAGARVFVECGPGTVLSGLVGATLEGRPHTVVNFERAGGGLPGALRALADLALAGVPVRPDRLFRGRDAVDLAAAPPAVAPRWTVDGHAVRTADGAFLPGGVTTPRPVDLTPAVTASSDDLIGDYLRTTREFIAAQREVMLAYLGTAPAPPRVVEPAPAPVPEIPHQAGPAPVEDTRSTVDRVRQVISDRTGYPLDLVEPDLDLEADLSIDSIKRTEIIGELAGATAGAMAAQLADSEIEELARMRTAVAIAGWLDARSGRPEPAPEPALEAGSEPAPGPDLQPDPAVERLTVTWTPSPVAGRLADLAGRRIAVSPIGTGPDASVGASVGAELARLLIERCAATVVGPDEPADDLVLLDALGAADDDEPAFLPEWFPVLRDAALTGSGVFVVVADGDPRADGLAGFFRSLRRERPEAIARLVAVEPGRSAAATAGAVLAELAVRDSEPVARLGSERLICTTSARPLEPAAATADAAAAIGLGPQSVLLAVGGARGITSVVTRQFAAASGCRVAVAGRTLLPAGPEDSELAAAVDLAGLRAVLAAREPGLPAAAVDARARAALARREVTRTLDGLRAVSRDAWYTPVDVTDAEAVHSLVKHVYARHGRLDGVIFAAGVIEDRLLADKSPESFRRVFATKVDGARNLLDALGDLPEGPRFVTLFGSIASVLGSRGQCDYAAANDAMAELGGRWAADTGRRCLTVHWGPWAPTGGGMVTPELAERFARQGVRLIDPVRGAVGLLHELAWGDPALTSVVYAAPGW
ncbi:type I polyketide synthase [Virgisporangium ochraceum]|uniref:Polyketide synthase n=1 Tax=Virgisporangium ochraceum TaxID=65505 RepID=A0A8J4EA92_9ACTN|nr:type I polyketide synthase [Virgisporangium ochraceum]GIJ67168.1 polyketide synthase [Virgisporangium ochraceum]